MMSGLAADGSWLDLAANWSGIFSAALALLVVALGFWVSTSAYQTSALLSRRRRYLGPVVRRAGLAPSRSRFRRTARRLLSRRVRSGRFEVRDELDWISELRPRLVPEDGLSPAHPVPLPFTFALPAAQYSAVLGQLAAAYAEYASAVRRRWLLRSAAGPLTAAEHECATATAGLLSRWSSFEPLPPDGADATGRLRGLTVELSRHDGPSSTTLIAWPRMNASRVIPGFPVIGVSYQPYRVALAGSPAASSGADHKLVRVVPAPPTASPVAASPLFYDGVLPRLHGPGFRIEIDRITGRQKLHLCVSETTYFAFQAAQPHRTAGLGAAGPGSDAAPASRLLSLNLLLIDADDVLILVRRSDYVVYPRQFSGTVTGNCELSPREGLTADLDPFGLPDLIGAVGREAREELGLDLGGDDSQLTALGVIDYSTEAERQTHALVATARLPGRARDFKVDRSAPDPAEGLWELGDEVLTVDLRAVLGSRRAGENFVRWLRSSDEISAAGAGSLLLLIAARLELQDNLAARAGINGGKPQPSAWTPADLAAWLSAGPPGRPVKPGRYLNRHPLWQ